MNEELAPMIKEAQRENKKALLQAYSELGLSKQEAEKRVASEEK